jgi:halimadienyl-diphosphate synthase
VTLAPWLTGHAQRIAFLLRTRRPDGAWGGPDPGYRLVPTLSATEALLTTWTRREPGSAELVTVIDQALAYLNETLPRLTAATLPDTPAIELLVPALVDLLNQRLHEVQELAGSRWAGLSFACPGGMDDHALKAVRSVLASGSVAPMKLLHSLEAAGDTCVNAAGVRPLPLGMVGASPAATAAWLGDPLAVSQRQASVRQAPVRQGALRRSAVRYLEAVASQHDGVVPSVIPVTGFERAWVLNAFATVQLGLTVPDELVAGLLASLGVKGAPGGPGLPADADTTSATYHALSSLGINQSMDCLRHYEADSHFLTWVGERTASASTNAHVLEALADRVDVAAELDWQLRAMDKVSSWLCERQLADGTWRDKWHASAYYATACSCAALRRVPGSGPKQAVRRAVEWVVGSQREDGSWGRWTGTAEETAYAIQILLLGEGGPDSEAVERAAARGYLALRAAAREPTECPPLWHDKDLYLPRTIVRAACLAAAHLVHETPAVMRRITRG